MCFYVIEKHSKFMLHNLQVLYILYIRMNTLWFYKNQQDNRVRSKLFVACQWWWFQWWFLFVLSIPGYLRGEEEHVTDLWRNPIERSHVVLHLEKEVYCVWQVVNTQQSFWITVFCHNVLQSTNITADCSHLYAYTKWYKIFNLLAPELFFF